MKKIMQKIMYSRVFIHFTCAQKIYLKTKKLFYMSVEEPPCVLV